MKTSVPADRAIIERDSQNARTLRVRNPVQASMMTPSMSMPPPSTKSGISRRIKAAVSDWNSPIRMAE